MFFKQKVKSTACFISSCLLSSNNFAHLFTRRNVLYARYNKLFGSNECCAKNGWSISAFNLCHVNLVSVIGSLTNGIIYQKRLLIIKNRIDNNTEKNWEIHELTALLRLFLMADNPSSDQYNWTPTFHHKILINGG